MDQSRQKRVPLEAVVCWAFRHNAVCLQASRARLRHRELPSHAGFAERVAQRSLTTLREKLVKIGARIVRHGRYVVFQLAKLAVPRVLFTKILRRIDGLRLRSPPFPA
jgi:hypothetical protein